MPIPALIGGALAAGSSILGGLLGRKSAKDQQSANTAMQKEFAQKGIQWRVADAKAAGLHPLAALGASGASFSPNPIVAGDYGLGAAGQQLGNAVSRYRSPREDTGQKALQAAQLRQVNAQTNLIETQAMASRMQMLSALRVSSKPTPVAGSRSGTQAAVAGSVDLQPAEQVSRMVGSPSAAAGNNPLWRWTQVGDNKFAFTMNQDVLEPDSPQGASIFAGSIMDPPSPPPAPPGMQYSWNSFSGTWSLVRKKAASRRRGRGQMGRFNR